MQEGRKYLISAYKFLSRRPRTEREVREKLQKWGTTEEESNEVVKRLKEEKLLDDFEYACSFIRTRNLLKPKPKRVLKTELLQKGVSEELADKALDLIEVDEAAIAKALVSKNEWKWRNFSESERKRKIAEFLMRKGFNLSTIKKITESIPL